MNLSSRPFWWGISTSAYQTEDVGPRATDESPFKTDWDLYFESGRLREAKGHGTFSFTQMERDIDALCFLGVDHYRFGIEWARVEPKPGQYDEKALATYSRLISKLKQEGITPIVCLWHFTFPDWATDLETPENNGWLHPLVVSRWPLFVAKVVDAFGTDVRHYAPQNEPNAHALAGYFMGIFPPGATHRLSLFRRQIEAAADFFIESAAIIKSKVTRAEIITIQNLVFWERAKWDIFNFFYRLGEEYNFRHLDRVHANADIIGINYYFKVKASPFKNPRIDFPEGLEHLIEATARRYSKPVLITENGVPDDGDNRRQRYLRTHVDAVQRAMANGHDVRGYFYWSLIDNFEWAEGYQEKFGLFRLNADNMSIEPKKSALHFKEMIAADRGRT